MDAALLQGWLGKWTSPCLTIMKIRALVSPLIFLILLAACKEERPPAEIKGYVPAESETSIWIDGRLMELSPGGKFTFSKDLEQYALIEASYGDLEWTIFLTPGAQLSLDIKDMDLQSIEYRGDQYASNSYLAGTSSLTREINTYFRQNWVFLHGLNQDDFVLEIDSLKGLYLEHLEKYSGRDELSTEFIDGWLAEIDYAFNALILRYPERYMQFPQRPISLNESVLDYLECSDPDRPECFSLPGYQSYTRAWLDYHATSKAEHDSSDRHFGLKKMDYLYEIISNSFESKFLMDYWKSECLVEHLEETRLSNSQPYLDLFLRSAESESAIAEVLKARKSQEESIQDHSVQVYKKERGFKLEAHLFSQGLNPMEKNAAIVIFHGGGWISGNPSWAFDRARHFSEQGMLAVAAQYRLTNEHDITAVESMADARDLVIWLRVHADSLNLNPDKVVGYGWSAGAHLISSAAIFPQSDPETGLSSIPNALVLISPAVSLPRGEGWEHWTYNLLGTKTTLDEVDPVFHIRKNLPPTIILQGRDDTVTPLDGVKRFSDSMNAQGNHCELWVYEGVGHLFTPNYLPDNGWPKPDKEVQEKVFDQIDLFLKTQGYIN